MMTASVVDVVDVCRVVKRVGDNQRWISSVIAVVNGEVGIKI